MKDLVMQIASNHNMAKRLPCSPPEDTSLPIMKRLAQNVSSSSTDAASKGLSAYYGGYRCDCTCLVCSCSSSQFYKDDILSNTYSIT